MALPRLRLTERQFLMVLMSATVLAVSAAVLGSSLFTGRGRKLEPVGRARARWMSPRATGPSELLADYFDPSLMSLPSPRGFSLDAWRHLAPPGIGHYAPLIPAAFLPAPSGLEVPTLLAPVSLADRVRANMEQAQAIHFEEVPTLPGELAAANSVVTIEGALASRHLLSAPVVPSAPDGLPVRRTRVLLGVGPDGRVWHAVLDRSSGSEALDTEAVTLTHELRFEPVASVDPLAVTWGAARFAWASASGN